MLISKNSAPKDSTCSFTADRVSKARTIAPMFLAWPIAARPATPPPITRIFAGGTFPAAVIWPESQCKFTRQTFWGKNASEMQYFGESSTKQSRADKPQPSLQDLGSRFWGNLEIFWIPKSKLLALKRLSIHGIVSYAPIKSIFLECWHHSRKSVINVRGGRLSAQPPKKMWQSIFSIQEAASELGPK